MKKRNIVILSIVAALLVMGCVGGYFAYTIDQAAKKAAEDKAYRQENVVMRQTGEVFDLSSEDASEGEQYGFDTVLDWSGTMRIILEEAVLYDSVEEASLPENALEAVGDVTPGSKYLQCKIKLKNIDAEPLSTSEDNSFNIGQFKLCAPDLPDRGFSYPFEPVYFNGTKEDALPTQIYHYTLEKGEEKTFELGYLLTEKEAGETLVFMIGINNNEKFQIVVAES
ncbi:DUF5027 family lipoprotein [Eggerthella sinensis]|uniref:DUF4352 domain-containing protein n=1 Tax=Eggerthella sinensis TaxID=242230 RepID=A0A3N0J0S1_9ACTN|nr:hypothetical protein [Eggerthella sinensis]RDB69871.1 hypothetical protein C1876_05625 [Eggerthella sinensis]RNM42767.1 hypothetical protein DMP09_03245 [Eggerthella sinensis]